jgi:hypothetical protein
MDRSKFDFHPVLMIQGSACRAPDGDDFLRLSEVARGL